MSITGVNILVKSLPLSIDEECLKKVLEEHGQVLKIQLIKYSWFQQKHAYIQYASRNSAVNAIKKLNNSTFHGKKITVNWTEGGDEMKSNNTDDVNSTCIEEKIKHISDNLMGNQLEEYPGYIPLYSQAGAEITLNWMTEDGGEMKNNNNDDDNPTCMEEKVKDITSDTNNQLDQYEQHEKVSLDSHDRISEMKVNCLPQKSESESASEFEKSSDKKANDITIKLKSEKRFIYVGWLSPHISETNLRDECSKYGGVEFVNLLKSSHRYKKEQHGYVRFDSNASAERAIKALNKSTVFSRTIIANLADWASSKSVSKNPIWKCMDPSCRKTNDIIDMICKQCHLAREKSDSHHLAILRKKIPWNPHASAVSFKLSEKSEGATSVSIVPTGKGRGECIALCRAARAANAKHSQWRVPPLEDYSNRATNQFCDKVEEWFDSSQQFSDQDEELKNPASPKTGSSHQFPENEELKNPESPKTASCPKEFAVNQSINHRFSSIIHEHKSAKVARSECQETISGVKYALEVSIKGEMDNLTNALKQIKKNNKKEVDKDVECLREQLIQLLKAVNWTKLASFYNKASSFQSTGSKMTEADILARLSWEDEKSMKLERRITRLKKHLHSIISTLEDIEEGNGVESVPDIEDSLRKVDECLDQPVQKIDGEMMLWAKLRIEDVLDKIDSAWNLVQGDSMMEIENPLGLFGNKYIKLSSSEKILNVKSDLT